MNRHTSVSRLLIPVLLWLLVATPLACNFASQPDPVVITATPSNPAMLDPLGTPAVPYVTPTTVVVPTPTVITEVAFIDAESALRNGDYTTAVAYFQDVLNRPFAEAEVRASAAFGLGEAALREGLYSEATVALSQFMTDYPQHPQVAHAVFLRGDAYLGLGEWTAAIADFRAYVQLRPGLIDSYVYERIGDAYLALDQPQQALDAYTTAANATRETAGLVELRERVAASYLNVGDIDSAMAQYDNILAVAENSFYKASIEWQAAQVLLAQEDFAGGYTRLQRLANNYPASWQAYQALAMLLDVGIEVDLWQQARIYYFNDDYANAINAINNYNSTQGFATIDALMMLGRSYREAGNPQAAITTFQTVLDNYPTDPAYGEAWLEQGRTYFLVGDINSAIAQYLALAENHPGLEASAEALWRAGYLYSTQDDAVSALSTFDILGQQYPGTEWAMEGLFLGATMAYNAGDTARAAQLFGQLAASGVGEQQAAAYLWIGRLYQLDGKSDLARQAYLAAANADPGGYYSARATDLLNGQQPFTPPQTLRFEFDDTAALNEAEAWLRSTFGITQEGALYPLGANLQTDERMVRGRELLIVGASGNAFEAAVNEFTDLRLAYAEDPLATYQLAVYLRDIGLYRQSIEAAAGLIIMSGVATTEAPGYIARLRYPIYYKDLVLPNCAKYEVDPLLVFSLIRQESLFEGFATSYAYAQGLMQIVPLTADEIAGDLGRDNFTDSDIYRPYVNVEFGIYYLSKVKRYVDDLPYAALAGYNCGPGSAREWLNISGPDLDLFVETITFPESRAYVTRIYEQYNVYRILYSAPS
jgi:soluble lytic murein transglycosylase